MRALRVVGITEGGGELSVVLEDPARRERFVVTADEQLRAAARGDLTRLGQIAIELESQLRPREIQARIRAGASVEQVASAAGVPVQKIERFAYPVLLERSRTAEVAQRAHPVRADGPDSRMLGDVVAHTFGLRGQEYTSAEWDSWKGEDGRWVVALSWRAGRSDNRAHWTFQPGAHGGTVTAVDEHAHDLVEGLPARPLRTVGPVIDIARADEPQPETDPHDGRELRAAASEGARGWAPEPGRVATERPPTRTAPEPRRPEPPLVRRSEPVRTEAPARPDGDGRLPDPRRDTDRPTTAPAWDRTITVDPAPAAEPASGGSPASGGGRAPDADRIPAVDGAPADRATADRAAPDRAATADRATGADRAIADQAVDADRATADPATGAGQAPTVGRDTGAEQVPAAEQAPAAERSSIPDRPGAAGAGPVAPDGDAERERPAGQSAARPATEPAPRPTSPADNAENAGEAPVAATPDVQSPASAPAAATPAATDAPVETPGPDAATPAGTGADGEPEPTPADATAADTTPAPDEPRKPAAAATRRTKKGKPVMPSWDEVLLGVRGQR